MDAQVMYASQNTKQTTKKQYSPPEIPCSASTSCFIKQRPYIGPSSHSKAHISSPLVEEYPVLPRDRAYHPSALGLICSCSPSPPVCLYLMVRS